MLRYDTRGHGGTDAPAGAYTLSQLPDDARALLEALGIARTHWVGMEPMVEPTIARWFTHRRSARPTGTWSIGCAR